jgi:hypothetical protein
MKYYVMGKLLRLSLWLGGYVAGLFGQLFVVHDDVQQVACRALVALERVGGPQYAIPGDAVLEKRHPARVEVVVSAHHRNPVAFLCVRNSRELVPVTFDDNSGRCIVPCVRCVHEHPLHTPVRAARGAVFCRFVVVHHPGVVSGDVPLRVFRAEQQSIQSGSLVQLQSRSDRHL